MGRPRGTKNKKKGIAPFELNADIEIIKENDDGTWQGQIIPFMAKAKIAGRTYQSEGTTLEEAILNLNPLIKKGICLLTVTHGERTITKILNGSITHNLFNKVSRVTHEVALKNLKTLFSF